MYNAVVGLCGADQEFDDRVRVDAHEMSDELRDETGAYVMAAYEAWRKCVDDVAMSLLSKPVAELYTTKTRMNLESTTLRADGVRHIRSPNFAMLTPQSRAIANKAADLPSGSGNGGGKPEGQTRRQSLEKKKAEADKKKNEPDRNEETRCPCFQGRPSRWKHEH